VLWDVEAPTFARQSADIQRWSCVSHAQVCLAPGRFLVLISVRGWVDPRAVVRLEERGLLKNPTTSSGIELTTFWLVAQCLNWLRYAVPQLQMNMWKSPWDFPPNAQVSFPSTLFTTFIPPSQPFLVSHSTFLRYLSLAPISLIRALGWDSLLVIPCSAVTQSPCHSVQCGDSLLVIPCSAVTDTVSLSFRAVWWHSLLVIPCSVVTQSPCHSVQCGDTVSLSFRAVRWDSLLVIPYSAVRQSPCHSVQCGDRHSLLVIPCSAVTQSPCHSVQCGDRHSILVIPCTNLA
jgi:hypothetical protein